jgi:YHYH protein
MKSVKAFVFLLPVLTLSLAAPTVSAQMPPRGDPVDQEQSRGAWGDSFHPPFDGVPRDHGRPPFRRNRVQPAKAATLQPSDHVLSALSPQQKIATFNGNVHVSLNGSFIEVESNGIPNHPTGAYPNEHNPNRILPQNYNFHIPLKPQFAESTTKLPFGPIGVAVNGIPFYNPYNAEGRDAVFGANAEIFDSCCGHPDPMGRYHYHKYPVCLNTPFHDQVGVHSPLIGWAFDGFAVYGPKGEDGRPPNDLDQCNGHVDSIRGYHYHVTNGFPYILGAYRGVVQLTNFDGPVWGRPGR